MLAALTHQGDAAFDPHLVATALLAVVPVAAVVAWRWELYLFGSLEQVFIEGDIVACPALAILLKLWFQVLVGDDTALLEHL